MVQREWAHLSLLTTGSAVNLSEYIPTFTIHSMWLIEPVHVTAGLAEDGAIIINTPKTPDEVRPLLKGYKGRVYTLDAKEISLKTLGKNFPNSPMLAAIVAVSGIMEEGPFLEDMRQSYQHKFAKKPEVIEGNMEALKLAFR